MLNQARALEGYRVVSPGGKVGRVKEFYFDDQHWVIRYLLVSMGDWRAERWVPIPPCALGAVLRDEKRIAIGWTARQIEEGASVNHAGPASPLFEEARTAHPGWPVQPGGPRRHGLPASSLRDPGERCGPAGPEHGWDTHVRSTHDLSGYQTQAVDGEGGHVEDVVIDDETWAIRYLIINTHGLWPGRRALVSAQWVERISWGEARVFVKLAREAIRHSTEFSEEALRTRDYETRLHRHYSP